MLTVVLGKLEREVIVDLSSEAKSSTANTRVRVQVFALKAISIC